jgi:hypothetical protein
MWLYWYDRAGLLTPEGSCEQGFFMWLSAPIESQFDFWVRLWGVFVWGHTAQQWSLTTQWPEELEPTTCEQGH